MQSLPDRVRDNEVSLLGLKDGRTLAFMEWGDRGGFPVFYFHGTPSCRLEGAFAEAAARRHRLRLISVDRPGMGQSSFKKGRGFRDWPVDVLELADALEIERFGVVGHSGAGPHLFACGAFIEPKRLAFVGAIGPWGPVATPEIMASLNSLDRFFAGMSQTTSFFMGLAFAPLGWCARHWQSLFMHLMKSSVSAPDKVAMSNERFLLHFRAMEKEAFRQGSRGGAFEAFIAFRRWDFDIADVKVPTYIWLGDDDIFVPRQMGEYIERRIPGVRLTWSAGKGHFNLEDWDLVFDACAPHAR